MTPEYVESLAKCVDPDDLWKTPVLERNLLRPDQREILDAGVALRRHAHLLRVLREALERRMSYIITPIAPSCNATKFIPIPVSHLTLVEQAIASGARPPMIADLHPDRPEFN